MRGQENIGRKASTWLNGTSRNSILWRIYVWTSQQNYFFFPNFANMFAFTNEDSISSFFSVDETSDNSLKTILRPSTDHHFLYSVNIQLRNQRLFHLPTIHCDCMIVWLSMVIWGGEERHLKASGRVFILNPTLLKKTLVEMFRMT